MTDDPRELARRARVAKFEKLKQHAQITTAAELLAKHKLPASVAEIEAGEKPGYPKRQMELFPTVRSRTVCTQSWRDGSGKPLPRAQLST